LVEDLSFLLFSLTFRDEFESSLNPIKMLNIEQLLCAAFATTNSGTE